MIRKVSGRTHSKAAKLSDKWGPPHCQTHHSNTIAYTRSSRAVGSGSIRVRGARSLQPAHGIPAELRNQPPLLSSIHYANRIRNTNLPSNDNQARPAWGSVVRRRTVCPRSRPGSAASGKIASNTSSTAVLSSPHRSGAAKTALI